MNKFSFLVIPLLMLCMTTACAGEKKYSLYGIGFYNLENLFDTCHDEGKNDYQYLPDGQNRWNGLKYSHKLRNMARVLAEMGTDRTPQGCAAIGVSEVENARCLADLCNQEPLKKAWLHVLSYRRSRQARRRLCPALQSETLQGARRKTCAVYLC